MAFKKGDKIRLKIDLDHQLTKGSKGVIKEVGPMDWYKVKFKKNPNKEERLKGKYLESDTEEAVDLNDEIVISIEVSDEIKEAIEKEAMNKIAKRCLVEGISLIKIERITALSREELQSLKERLLA